MEKSPALQKRSSLSTTLSTSWVLTTHLLAALILTLVLVLSVQDHVFSVSRSDNLAPNNVLSQSTVNGLISAALTVIKALAGSWISLAGWRLAVAVLERNGASLGDVNRLISYRFPPLRISKQPRSISTVLLIAIFILSIPPQFASPILQGSINWIPVSQFPKSGRTIAIQNAANGTAWHDLQFNFNYRMYMILHAAGYSAFASRLSFTYQQSMQQGFTPPSRRVVPELESLTLQTGLDGIRMPYFKINSLDWSLSGEEMAENHTFFTQLISNKSVDLFSFSRQIPQPGYNPMFLNTDVGKIVLVNDNPYPTPEDNEEKGSVAWPDPVLQTKSSYVVLGLSFGGNCSYDTYNAFGPVSSRSNFTAQSLYLRDCYIVGRLNYTAGAINCKNCSTVLDSIAEASTEYLATQEPEADSLVEPALAMMPEVLYLLEAANASRAATWGNIDGYVAGMVATAYQVSWNSLAMSTRSANATQTATISTPISMLRAEISAWRVGIWLMANMALTISGLLLGIVFRSSELKVRADPWLFAWLIDSGSILDKGIDDEFRDGTIGKRLMESSIRIDLDHTDDGYERARLVFDGVEDGRSVRRRHGHGSEEELCKSGIA